MIQSKECLSIFFIFPQAFRGCPQAKQYDTVDKQHQLIQQKKRQQKKQKDAAACVPCVVQHSGKLHPTGNEKPGGEYDDEIE